MGSRCPGSWPVGQRNQEVVMSLLPDAESPSAVSIAAKHWQTTVDGGLLPFRNNAPRRSLSTYLSRDGCGCRNRNGSMDCPLKQKSGLGSLLTFLQKIRGVPAGVNKGCRGIARVKRRDSSGWAGQVTGTFRSWSCIVGANAEITITSTVNSCSGVKNAETSRSFLGISVSMIRSTLHCTVAHPRELHRTSPSRHMFNTIEDRYQ